jgi:hypothetical protein
MTIELSLRKRALQARGVSIIFLSTAVLLLLSTYISLPFIADKTLDSINAFELHTVQSGSIAKDESSGIRKSFSGIHVFALTTMVLGVSAISLGCYLLGKGAFMEMERAGRLCGIADALCISGDSLEQFEKAVTLLVPKGEFHTMKELFSADDLKSLAEILKPLR